MLCSFCSSLVDALDVFFFPRFSGAAVCQSLLHELAGRTAVLGHPAPEILEDLDGFEVIQHTPFHWMGWHLATISNDFKWELEFMDSQGVLDFIFHGSMRHVKIFGRQKPPVSFWISMLRVSVVLRFRPQFFASASNPAAS